MIRSCGPPNNTTPGNVGDIYQDINTGRIYRCKDVKVHQNDHGYVTVSDYCPKNEYMWDDMSNDYDEGYADGDARYFGVVGCVGLFQNNTTLTSERLGELLTYASTAKVTDMSNMFNDCSSLTSIPELNTVNVMNMHSMFYNCFKLTSIPRLDFSKVLSTGSMFYGCSSLTSLYIHNIRISLEIGSGTSWGHLLTVDSIIHTIQELCTVSAQQKLTMGSANLAKIADLYCKITDDTNEKLTMELCESTDEGAMTLAEYAGLKNWVFA